MLGGRTLLPPGFNISNAGGRPPHVAKSLFKQGDPPQLTPGPPQPRGGGPPNQGGADPSEFFFLFFVCYSFQRKNNKERINKGRKGDPTANGDGPLGMENLPRGGPDAWELIFQLPFILAKHDFSLRW